MLKLEQISASYGKRAALKNITLTARQGEILGLIGPNGAGKSSLMRVISGALTPNTGAVRLDETDLARMDRRARARTMAVVPQNSNLPDAFTVGEAVLMGRTPYLSFFGAERACDFHIAENAMRRTDTLQFVERFVGELSGGERQRVMIARALTQEPRVLLLDEATAHLDLKHQTAIWELVRQLARTGLIVIAALHDLNLAAQSVDRLALLRGGELLVCDSPARVLTRDWLRRGYDVSALICAHPLYQTPMVALIEEGRSNDE